MMDPELRAGEMRYRQKITAVMRSQCRSVAGRLYEDEFVEMMRTFEVEFPLIQSTDQQLYDQWIEKFFYLSLPEKDKKLDKKNNMDEVKLASMERFAKIMRDAGMGLSDEELDALVKQHLNGKTELNLDEFT